MLSTAKSPLISSDTAKERIGSETLAVLADAFKGELGDIRHRDERDHLF